MARHADGGRRRGVAPWIVVTAVVVVVLAAATVIWVSVTGRDEQDTATCTSDAVLSVLASPGAVDGMTAAAVAFDATRPVARSTCITTAVEASTDGTAAVSLLDGSAQDATGPAIWAAGSETEVTALESQDAALTAGRDDRPEATSPVVLAVGDGDVAALTGATWSDLPVVLAPGGPLALVLPDPTANRASSYALQSVVAGSTNAGPATDAAPAVDAAAVTAAAPALRALAAGAITPGSTADALGALAPGQVVPVVESELIAWNRDHPEAPLTAVHPGGPTAGDTVLVVQLTAPWVDPTAADAAGRFAGFLRGEPGRRALADSGLRVDGISPTTPDSRVDPTAAVQLLAPAGGEVIDQLDEAVSG